MAVYSMLTDVGLSEINGAQPGSIYVEVAYWVAAFDQDLDDDYNGLNGPTGEARARDISNYTTPSDQYPSGSTRYWNTLSAGAEPPSLTNPNVQYLYPGVSFQPVVETDATNFRGTWDGQLGTFPTDPSVGDYWTVNPAGTLYETPGDESGIYFGAGDDLVFNGVAFKNGVEPNRRGNFKVIVEDNTKTMEINKIALYGIRRSEDGTIQTSPFLLGQVIIPKAQLIQPRTSTDSFSVDQLVVDFQIDTQAVLTNFDDIIFSSQKDYWSRVVDNDGQYGLEYDGQVYITNRLGIEDASSGFPSSEDAGVAKLMVATYETVNKPNPTEEKDMPQLVLQYVKSNVFPANNDNAYSPRVRTTFRTTDEGNCEIDFYGSCSNEFGYYSLIPQEDRSFGLGNNNKRWRSLKTSNRMELYLGEEYTTIEVDVVNISGSSMPTGTNIIVDDANATPITVKIAESEANSVGQTSENIPNGDTGKARIRRDDRWDYIKRSREGSYHPSQEYGYIVIRDNDLSKNPNLGMAHFGNSSIEIGPHYDSRDIQDGILGFKENYYYMYGNISNYIGTADELGETRVHRDYPLNVRSTQDIALYTIARDTVSEYEKDGLSATTWRADSLAVLDEIYNLIKVGKNRIVHGVTEDSFVDNVKGGGDLPTIFDNLYGRSKWEANKENLISINDLRESLFGSVEPTGNPDSLGDALNHDVLLTSSRFIYTMGDIVPMVDRLNNIGASEYAYNRMYVAEIFGSGRTDSDTYPILGIRGDVYPTASGTKIGRDNRVDNNQGFRWAEFNSDRLGNNGDWINDAYIQRIKSNRIDMYETADGTKGHIQFNGKGHIGFGSNGTYINNGEIKTSNIICDNITVNNTLTTKNISVENDTTEIFNDTIALKTYENPDSASPLFTDHYLATDTSSGFGIPVEIIADKNNITNYVNIRFRIRPWGGNGSEGCAGSPAPNRQIIDTFGSGRSTSMASWIKYQDILDVLDIDYVEGSVELLGAEVRLGGDIYGTASFSRDGSCFKRFGATIGYGNTVAYISSGFDRNGFRYITSSNVSFGRLNDWRWLSISYQPRV